MIDGASRELQGHIQEQEPRNWSVRIDSGRIAVEPTTEATGFYESVDSEAGSDHWVVPGDFVDSHPAVLADGHSADALTSAVQEWMRQQGYR